MTSLLAAFRVYLVDKSGVATVEWVAVTGSFVVIGILITYLIFGDSDGGLIALVDGQTDKVSAASDDINDLVSDVEGWSPD